MDRHGVYRDRDSSGHIQELVLGNNDASDEIGTQNLLQLIRRLHHPSLIAGPLLYIRHFTDADHRAMPGRLRRYSEKEKDGGDDERRGSDKK
jgi:hypothetical protein